MSKFESDVKPALVSTEEGGVVTVISFMGKATQALYLTASKSVLWVYFQGSGWHSRCFGVPFWVFSYLESAKKFTFSPEKNCKHGVSLEVELDKNI